MPEKTMMDASVPNAGRIYDYLLGGHHNFEIDRRVGDQIKALLPFLPKAMRLSRWCLQDVARTLTEERGFDTIVDLAVEYGREILGDTPNTYYFEADCRRPEELLTRSEVKEVLGDNRHVAFVYWGVSMYLTDEDIAHAARILYDWSDEESCLAFYLAGMADRESPEGAKMYELYRQMGEELYDRPLKVFEELVRPWRPDELGFRSMAEWHGIEVAMSEEDLKIFAAGGSGHGVYLVK
jgi:hypothetical protein